MESKILRAWNQSYSVGVDNLDQDHRKLVDMINKLHEAMTTGQSNAVISPLISSLKEYSLTHFNNEETYMQQINYPNLEDQKKQHDIFVNKIKEFESELLKGNKMLATRVIPFLSNWLFQHIMNEDMKYSKP
jgi:hemerythrin